MYIQAFAFHRPNSPSILITKSRKPAPPSLLWSSGGHEGAEMGKFFKKLYSEVQQKLSEGEKFELISWAFRYGDTRPFSEKSVVGALFLATNVCYFLSSVNLYQADNIVASLYGVIIDIAGLFSSIYHYTQLRYGPNRIEVYPPLFLDYFSALFAVSMTFYVSCKFFSAGYLLNEHVLDALMFSIVSVASFVTSWTYEVGVPYLIFHGLWHVLSAAAVNEIGVAEKLLHVLG